LDTLNFDRLNPIKIVKVKVAKDKKRGRVKGFHVRIPTKVAKDMGLKGEEWAVVYANYDKKGIAYEIIFQKVKA